MTGQNGNSKDLYALLGVERDASQGQIKSEYRWLAKKFHPDTNQGDSRSAKRFQEINDAYGVISNPALRAAYDSSRPEPPESANRQNPDYSKPTPTKPAPTKPAPTKPAPTKHTTSTKGTNSSAGRSSRTGKKRESWSPGEITILWLVGVFFVMGSFGIFYSL